MTSELIIQKRMTVAKQQMMELLRSISTDYRQGRIKSPAELQRRVYADLQSFYQSIGAATFKQIKAVGPPYSADHNRMMEQIQRDLGAMYQEISAMTQDVMDNFEVVELERQSFSKRTSEVERLLRTIESNYSKRSHIQVFREDFTSIDLYDRGASDDMPAYLSADEGILSLERVSEEQFNPMAKITVISGNGFPGNTHVVRTEGDSLRFDGADSLHINLADVLDQNKDTWYEYELFTLTEEGEKIIENKGVEYEEPVKWANQQTDELRCVIQIDLSDGQIMNWISMSPYIPSDRGAIPAVIEKVVVSDEKGTVKGMGYEHLFAKGQVFVFPRQKCKTITLYLRQATSYKAQVGHVYYLDINKDLVALMDEKRQYDGIRVHGASAPSITNLGISYDTGKNELVYPIMKYGDKIEDEPVRRKNLFDLPETSPSVFAGLEQVPAYRYMVGLRDVTLASYQFAAKSEYVSKVYATSTPIQELSLDSTFDVPDIFGEAEQWVTFYLSVDNGQKWHEIAPKDAFKDGVKNRYLINSGVPKEGRLMETGYIETLTDVHEVRLKIVLKRPLDIADAQYYTPVIHEYELQAVTLEE